MKKTDALEQKPEQKMLKYQNFTLEYLENTVESVCSSFINTPWFPPYYSENEIKQSIRDRLNHRELTKLSIICIDLKTDRVLAGYFAVDLLEYLNLRQKWSFHNNYEVIDQAPQIVKNQLKIQEQQKSVWSFWMFNLTADHTMLHIVLNLVGKNCLLAGYDQILIIEGILEYERIHNVKNLQIQPVLTKFKNSFQTTENLYLEITNSIYSKYMKDIINWIKPILISQKVYQNQGNYLIQEELHQNKEKYRPKF